MIELTFILDGLTSKEADDLAVDILMHIQETADVLVLPDQ